ncbi:MAG TPA: hypothetical protein VHF26_12550 [Trebonia sp.]|nr:hypothetical protein [Trebonia sp.]
MGEVAVAGPARASRERPAVRRRAVGTRDRIIAHLALVAEVADGTGMASTRLAEAVGYPGTSVAFAQLLSGMERDGLISREVRGKRTYRIALRYPEDEGAAAPDDGPAVVPAAAVEAPDYDKLADRVLVRLIRRLAQLSPAELATLERLLVPGRARAEEHRGDGRDERGSSLKIV